MASFSILVGLNSLYIDYFFSSQKMLLMVHIPRNALHVDKLKLCTDWFKVLCQCVRSV